MHPPRARKRANYLYPCAAWGHVHVGDRYEQTVFRYLKDAGYTTVHLGKNDELAQASFNLSYT